MTDPAELWNKNWKEDSIDKTIVYLKTLYPGFWRNKAKNATERLDPKTPTYNIVNIGHHGSGKTSYLNSLLSIFEGNDEYNLYSVVGNPFMPGTITMDGPYPMGDHNRPVVNYYTTVGTQDITENDEQRKLFQKVMKNLLRGKINANADLRFINARDFENQQRMFQRERTKLPCFHMVHIVCAYGRENDAKIALEMVNFFHNEIGIPYLVIVTHANGEVYWESLASVIPGRLFFVDNYIEVDRKQEGRHFERLTEDKSKVLLHTLLESIKIIERSGNLTPTTTSPFKRYMRKILKNVNPSMETFKSIFIMVLVILLGMLVLWLRVSLTDRRVKRG